MTLKGWKWQQVCESPLTETGSDVPASFSLLTQAVWDIWPPEVSGDCDWCPRAWSLELQLLMQHDTPIERRRAGSRAWTQAAFEVKTQLLLMATGLVALPKRKPYQRSTKKSVEPYVSMSKLIEWKNSCPLVSLTELLCFSIWVKDNHI